MPKPRGCQLSGAKKRQLAKQKSEKAKSEIASAPRLDRYLVHSTAKSDCESENVATSTSSRVYTSRTSILTSRVIVMPAWTVAPLDGERA